MPRVDTFKTPHDAHVQSGVIDPEAVEEENKSIFKQQPPKPKTMMWRCLDSDGVETEGCDPYEYNAPPGSHPSCPSCGSKVAMPVEAYSVNERQRLDKLKSQW